MTCTREGCRGRKHIKAAWNFVSCQGLDSCVFEATFAIPGLALKGLRPALKLNLHQTVCKYVSRKVLRATFWGEIVVGMFDPMKYMKSGGKAIKPGVQGDGRGSVFLLRALWRVPLHTLPGFGGPSLKGHLCRLKVRLKRGRGTRGRK